MKTWSVRGVKAVLAVVVLVNGVRAAELGLPENCVELKSVPSLALISHTWSTRDSAVLRIGQGDRFEKLDGLGFGLLR